MLFSFPVVLSCTPLHCVSYQPLSVVSLSSFSPCCNHLHTCVPSSNQTLRCIIFTSVSPRLFRSPVWYLCYGQTLFLVVLHYLYCFLLVPDLVFPVPQVHSFLPGFRFPACQLNLSALFSCQTLDPSLTISVTIPEINIFGPSSY